MLVLFFRCFHDGVVWVAWIFAMGFFFLRHRLYVNYQSSPPLGEMRTQLKPHNLSNFSQRRPLLGFMAGIVRDDELTTEDEVIYYVGYFT